MGPGALTQRDRQNIERMTRPEPNEVIQDEQVRRIRQGGSRGGRSRVALLHARHAEGPNRLLDAMNTLHQTAEAPEGDDPDPAAPWTLEAPPGKLAMRLTEPVRQDISAAAHSVGFPQELAQECLNAITNGHKAPVPSFAPFSGTREAGIAQLQRTWGRHFEERVSLGTYAAEHLGWLDALHATNQSRNPAIVRGLATLGALWKFSLSMRHFFSPILG